jgi:putative endonuclease
MVVFYYVYVLQSEKDSKFYTGYTKNLKLRFKQHKKGLIESTSKRMPLHLIYYEACLNQKKCYSLRKTSEEISGKDVSEKPSQILFNKVNLTDYLFLLK